MTAEIGLGFSMLLTLIGAVVWAVRIEGKVVSLKELSEERKEQADARHQELLNWLQRLDAKIGYRNGHQTS